MTARSGIIAGGNWLLDHVKVIDAWPEQDSLATIVEESISNGGAPYNVLKDLSLLGAPFPLEAIGLLGDDSGGRWIHEDCRAHRIGTRQLHSTRAASTSHTDVMTVQSTGRRTFFHHRGANSLLAPEHFDFSATPARFFHLGYLLLLDELDRLGSNGLPRAVEVLRRAREAGLQTSLDCVSAYPERFATVVTPTLPFADVLFANDFEAEKLTGIDLRCDGRFDAAAVERAARVLLEAGVRNWVIIHLPEAVHARSRDTGVSHWQSSVRVPAGDIRGAAGAGDALAAGVLFGLHEGWSMPRALELGVCAAASSLYHPTCSASVRPASECLEIGQRLGFQPAHGQRSAAAPGRE